MKVNTQKITAELVKNNPSIIFEPANGTDAILIEEKLLAMGYTYNFGETEGLKRSCQELEKKHPVPDGRSMHQLAMDIMVGNGTAILLENGIIWHSRKPYPEDALLCTSDQFDNAPPAQYVSLAQKFNQMSDRVKKLEEKLAKRGAQDKAALEGKFKELFDAVDDMNQTVQRIKKKYNR